MSLPPLEGENHIGSASMNTPANNNLVLTAFSSFEQLAELLRQPNSVGLYQALARSLIGRIRANHTFHVVTARLASIADHGYLIRNAETVGLVGELLLSLPVCRALERAGNYYHALSLNEPGADSVNVASLLEGVADSGSSDYRARATLALGSSSFRIGDHLAAMSYYRETMRIMKCDHIFDPATLYFTSRMTAVVKAAEGDHRSALADLEKMFPLVRMASARQPYAYYDYLNSLAVELTEAGRLEEARNASRIALASPFAQAYPEWRDTFDEINHRELRASRSTVAVTQRALKEKNLVAMPLPRRGLPITARAEESQPPARIIKFPTRFPIRTPSTSEQNERGRELEPFDKRRIVSEKLYEMFLSALDDGPVNRDLVEELYKTFLKKQKQS
jgi:tetratricopeptide (TPR) repeat protein